MLKVQSCGDGFAQVPTASWPPSPRWWNNGSCWIVVGGPSSDRPAIRVTHPCGSAQKGATVRTIEKTCDDARLLA